MMTKKHGLFYSMVIMVACFLAVVPVFAQNVENKPSSEEVFESYKKIASDSPSGKTALSNNEIMELFSSTESHPVASLWNVYKYDPTGGIGFCFGRAMTANLNARCMGLATASIRKLFVIGDLRSGPDPEWRFHVTTLVSSPDGRWISIDPVIGRAVPIKTWISEVGATWDKQSRAKFYIVPAYCVLPSLDNVPAIDEEKGESIIEVSFDPTTKQGFTHNPDQGDRVFELDAEHADEYFKVAAETETANNFDFLEISVNNESLSYNKYFIDLLQSFETPAAAFAMMSQRPLMQNYAASYERAKSNRGTSRDLHSMRLHELVPQTKK